MIRRFFCETIHRRLPLSPRRICPSRRLPGSKDRPVHQDSLRASPWPPAAARRDPPQNHLTTGRRSSVSRRFKLPPLRNSTKPCTLGIKDGKACGGLSCFWRALERARRSKSRCITSCSAMIEPKGFRDIRGRGLRCLRDRFFTVGRSLAVPPPEIKPERSVLGPMDN